MKTKSIKINSILNVIKTLSSILFPLITFPYVSRVLQPTNIGKISFGTSFISYFTLIATLGITTYAIRECSAVREDKEKLSEVSSEIFSISVCTTIVAYVLLLLSLLFFRKLDSYRTIIIIQSTAILFTTVGADWLNTAMEDFGYITIRTISFQVISLFLMFIFIKSPNDYVKYAFITVISSSGANVLNIFYRKKYCKISLTSKMKWGVHFKPILLLFVMILAQTIFNSADITMIGLLKGNFEVGLYSTAVKIENIIAQVVSSLAWVVMPRMSMYFEKEDYYTINILLKKVLSILLFIGLPSVAGVLSLSNEIVVIVGGESYIQSALPLSILIFSFAFSLIGGSFLGNMVLLPSKKETIYMKICCFATLINVILNYFFIPIYGSIAAAGTTAFCSFIMMVLMIIKKDKRVKLDYVWDVLKAPLLGSICIILFCSILKNLFTDLLIRTIVCIFGSVFLYVFIMLIIKNDILYSFIRPIVRKIRGKQYEK